MGDWTQEIEDEQWLFEEFDYFDLSKDRRIAPVVAYAEAAGKYGPRAAYAFTINYILGVGCLGIPYALSKAGLLLGSFILCVVTAFSFLTVVWVAECVARAEKLAKLPCECGHRRWMCLNDHSIGVVPDDAMKPSDLDPILDHSLPAPQAVKRRGVIMQGSRGRSDSGHLMSPEDVSPRFSTRSSALATLTARSLSSVSSTSEQDDLLNSYQEYERMNAPTRPAAPEKCYEVVELCYKFQGPYGRLLYQLSLLGLMYVGLLAYTQVFNAAVMGYFNLAEPQRVLVTLGYAIFVVPVSCCELSEQIPVQVAMAVMRFVSLGAMVLAAVYGIFADSLDGGFAAAAAAAASPISSFPSASSLSSLLSSPPTSHHFSPTTGGIAASSHLTFTASGASDATSLLPPLITALGLSSSSSPAQPPSAGTYYYVSPGLTWVNFAFFGLMFSTALFSQLFQHSVPGLLNPLPVEVKKNKTTVLFIFSSALATTLVAYLLLGGSCAIYFGPSLIAKSVNLNFAHFSWGADVSKMPAGASQTLALIRALIVLFPAMDTFSVFPLIAVTLGNNFASFFPKLPNKLKVQYNIGLRQYYIFWRLVACVPPIALSYFLTDLAWTIQMSGFCGVYVAFITPALLQYASARSCQRQFGSSATVYSGLHSNNFFVALILLFSVFAICVLTYETCCR